MEGSLVYTNINLTDSAGVVNFAHHTTAVYIANRETNSWVDVKFNGGPHIVSVPDVQGHSHGYVCIPGDYTSIQVITAGGAVAVYAIG